MKVFGKHSVLVAQRSEIHTSDIGRSRITKTL